MSASDLAWMSDAACRDADPVIFDHELPEAVALCSGCPVASRCPSGLTPVPVKTRQRRAAQAKHPDHVARMTLAIARNAVARLEMVEERRRRRLEVIPLALPPGWPTDPSGRRMLLLRELDAHDRDRQIASLRRRLDLIA